MIQDGHVKLSKSCGAANHCVQCLLITRDELEVRQTLARLKTYSVAAASARTSRPHIQNLCEDHPMRDPGQ